MTGARPWQTFPRRSVTPKSLLATTPSSFWPCDSSPTRLRDRRTLLPRPLHREPLATAGRSLTLPACRPETVTLPTDGLNHADPPRGRGIAPGRTTGPARASGAFTPAGTSPPSSLRMKRKPAMGVLPAACLPCPVLARRGNAFPVRVGGVWNLCGPPDYAESAPSGQVSLRSSLLPRRTGRDRTPHNWDASPWDFNSFGGQPGSILSSRTHRASSASAPTRSALSWTRSPGSSLAAATPPATSATFCVPPNTSVPGWQPCVPPSRRARSPRPPPAASATSTSRPARALGPSSAAGASPGPASTTCCRGARPGRPRSVRLRQTRRRSAARRGLALAGR